MKKRYKLKKSFKIFLILLILISIAGFIGINKYKEYKYKQTAEYKLLTIGYNQKEIKLILKNDVDYFLNHEKDVMSLKLLQEKYYLKKNFKRYQTFLDNNNIPLRDTISLVNVNRDYLFYENVVEADISKKELMLVNKYFKLNEEYSPTDLVNISSKYSWGQDGTHKISTVVYDAFLNMWADAWENEEIYLMINSSYRPYQKQLEIYENLNEIQGEKYADSIAARPGHSEHQTGLALDIFSKKDTSQKEFENSPTYSWLKENAHKYGFIIRYPKEKTNLTGYQFESWHYRYVGQNVAKHIHENEITFDEYYAFYL